MGNSNRVFIGGYKGKSFVSKCIKWATWKLLSHISLIKINGATIQSWHKGGTLLHKDPWELHTEGTPIDIYALSYPEEFHGIIWEKALKKVGSKYDFRALLGFIPFFRKLWKDNPDKWFCSHQVADDCLVDDEYRLFNTQLPTYKIDPGLLVASPYLYYIGTATNFLEFKIIVEMYMRNR